MNVLRGVENWQRFAVRHIVYFEAQLHDTNWYVLIQTVRADHTIAAENREHAEEIINRIEEAINRVRF